MIVLDEHLKRQVLKADIVAWYPGQVISVSNLRSESIIKDEVIPTLLLKMVQPTFVTINSTDFWKKALRMPAIALSMLLCLKSKFARFPEFCVVYFAYLILKQKLCEWERLFT